MTKKKVIYYLKNNEFNVVDHDKDILTVDHNWTVGIYSGNKIKILGIPHDELDETHKKMFKSRLKNVLLQFRNQIKVSKPRKIHDEEILETKVFVTSGLHKYNIINFLDLGMERHGDHLYIKNVKHKKKPWYKFW